jgi:hypothetical protein
MKLRVLKESLQAFLQMVIPLLWELEQKQQNFNLTYFIINIKGQIVHIVAEWEK